MKKCRTVNGLIRAVKAGVPATLEIWGVMPNGFNPQGAYLNLGANRFAYVGEANWEIIKNHLTVRS